MNNIEHMTIPRILKALYPISRLEDPYQEKLLGKTTLEHVSAGHTLHAEPEKEWFTYLVSGELDIQTGRSVRENIMAGAPRCRMPLFKTHTAEISARSRTKSTLLRIGKKDFLELTGNNIGTVSEERDNKEIFAGDSQKSDKELIDILYHDHLNASLHLPSLPDVALKIHRAMDNPDLTVRDIAKLVLADPALSAKMVQAANSSVYSVSPRVETVLDAITRLGLNAAQNMALNLSIEKLFNANSSVVHNLLQEFYQHSLVIGSLSYVIAKDSTGLNPQKALLAGLIHDIGIVPILAAVKKSGVSLVDEKQLRDTIKEHRAIAGNMAINSLGLGQEMITVAEEAEEWYRDPSPEPDYCDVVLLAQLYSQLGTPMMKNLPRIDTIPAYHKLQSGDFDPEKGLTILNNGKNVAQALQSLIG